MALQVVKEKAVGSRLAGRAFGISQTCYRYQTKLSSENSEISDWLIRLRANQRNGRFGRYFCICVTSKARLKSQEGIQDLPCQLELNLRSKPKKRLVREKPESLGPIIYNIYISYSAKDEAIADIVHRMRPFSVADETKQQARSSGR